MLLWSGNTKNSHDIVWPAGEMTESAFGEMEDFSMKKTIYANIEPISDREAIQRLALAAKAGEQAAKEVLCERFKGLIYSLSKTAYETLPAEEARQELWLGVAWLSGMSGKVRREEPRVLSVVHHAAYALARRRYLPRASEEARPRDDGIFERDGGTPGDGRNRIRRPCAELV